MAGISPTVWRILFNRMHDSNSGGGLFGGAPSPGLLSPNFAAAPTGPVAPDMPPPGPSDGGVPSSPLAASPFHYHAARQPGGLEQRLSSPIAQAGLSILAGQPEGSTASALGQGVEQALAAAKARRNRAVVQDWMDTVERHFPDGNIPPHVLQEAIGEGVTTGNRLLLATAKSYLDAQAAAAQAKLPQGSYHADEQGRLYNTYRNPQTGELVTQPVPGPGGQLSEGPKQASIAPSQFDWYDASQVGLPAGLGQVKGGFVTDSSGTHFVPAMSANQKLVTRKTPSAPAGDKERQTLSRLDLLGQRERSFEAINGDMAMAGLPRQLEQGENLGSALARKLHGSLDPESAARLTKAVGAARFMTDDALYFLSGRKGAFQWQQLHDAMFPPAGTADQPGVAETYAKRRREFFQTMASYYRGDLTYDEAYAKATASLGVSAQGSGNPDAPLPSLDSMPGLNQKAGAAATSSSTSDNPAGFHLEGS